MGYHPHFAILGCTKWVASPLDGCKNGFLEWRLEIKCLHVSTKTFYCERTRTQGTYKLVKSLYGLKQAPRSWYENLTKHILKLNFKHYNLDDAKLFLKKVGRSVVFLRVYVDDLLMTGNNESYIASIKAIIEQGL